MLKSRRNIQTHFKHESVVGALLVPWKCDKLLLHAIPHDASHSFLQDGAGRRTLCHVCIWIITWHRSTKRGSWNNMSETFSSGCSDRKVRQSGATVGRCIRGCTHAILWNLCSANLLTHHCTTFIQPHVVFSGPCSACLWHFCTPWQRQCCCPQQTHPKTSLANRG